MSFWNLVLRDLKYPCIKGREMMENNLSMRKTNSSNLLSQDLNDHGLLIFSIPFKLE
jgi:hypothetical protein